MLQTGKTNSAFLFSPAFKSRAHHTQSHASHVGHVHYVNNVAFVRPILTFAFLLISSTDSAGSERDKYESKD